MKVLVFSDVHGNLEVFEKLINQHKDSDLFICLGDVVNYGPFSNECVDLLDSLPSEKTIKIIGNHEEIFLDGVYSGRHPIARAFYDFCLPEFDRFEQISNYQYCYQNFDFYFVHTILDTYIYSDSEISIQKNYIVGHSHRQFKINDGNFNLYNPGSVGQNRVNIENGQYLLLFPEKKTIEFKSIAYDFNKLINEMKAKGYPDNCIEYYLQKKRFEL